MSTAMTTITAIRMTICNLDSRCLGGAGRIISWSANDPAMSILGQTIGIKSKKSQTGSFPHFPEIRARKNLL
jgi:hypothetical protein